MSNDKSEAFTMGPVTLAFPSPFTKSAPRNSTSPPRYNTTILVTADQYRDIIYPKLSKFAAEAFKNGETGNPKFSWPFTECKFKLKNYPEAGKRGMLHANLKSDYPLTMVDSNRQPIVDPLIIKDGGLVYVSMSFRSYTKGNIGIAVDPGPIMLIGQGEVLNVGGGLDVDSAFAGIQVNAAVAPPSATPSRPATPAGVPAMPPLPGR